MARAVPEPDLHQAVIAAGPRADTAARALDDARDKRRRHARLRRSHGCRRGRDAIRRALAETTEACSGAARRDRHHMMRGKMRMREPVMLSQLKPDSNKQDAETPATTTGAANTVQNSTTKFEPRITVTPRSTPLTQRCHGQIRPRSGRFGESAGGDVVSGGTGSAPRLESASGHREPARLRRSGPRASQIGASVQTPALSLSAPGVRRRRADGRVPPYRRSIGRYMMAAAMASAYASGQRCHPDRGWSDNRPRSVSGDGAGGIRRSAPMRAGWPAPEAWRRRASANGARAL